MEKLYTSLIVIVLCIASVSAQESRVDQRSVSYQLGMAYGELLADRSGVSGDAREAYAQQGLDAIDSRQLDPELKAALYLMRMQSTDLFNEALIAVPVAFHMMERDADLSTLYGSNDVFRARMGGIMTEIIDRHIPVEVKAEMEQLAEQGIARTRYSDYYRDCFEKENDSIAEQHQSEYRIFRSWYKKLGQ